MLHKDISENKQVNMSEVNMIGKIVCTLFYQMSQSWIVDFGAINYIAANKEVMPKCREVDVSKKVKVNLLNGVEVDI